MYLSGVSIYWDPGITWQQIKNDIFDCWCNYRLDHKTVFVVYSSNSNIFSFPLLGICGIAKTKHSLGNPHLQHVGGQILTEKILSAYD
jgi:hypothetical protein